MSEYCPMCGAEDSHFKLNGRHAIWLKYFELFKELVRLLNEDDTYVNFP